MAKGFTVKAKPPTAKGSEEFEWDYEKIKARMRGKRIVICLPGRGCSYAFLQNFVRLVFDIYGNGMSLQICQDYSSMVNFARCKCLGANVLRGPNQIPWDGKLPYDYQLWIDSDILFSPEKFWQLCDLAFPESALQTQVVWKDSEGNNVPEGTEGAQQVVTAVTIEEYRRKLPDGNVGDLCDPEDSDAVLVHKSFLPDPEKDHPISSGWYCTEDGRTTSVAHWLEEDDFRKNNGVMDHENIESISKRKKPFTVDYTGFGWVMIKNGVFEHEEMKYPWFAPQMQVFESGEVQDMCGEDVSFCLDAKEAGFEIWCDPRIRVGHEKTRII
jgi:hypothetical protein